jgi:hypothetical protein
MRARSTVRSNKTEHQPSAVSSPSRFCFSFLSFTALFYGERDIVPPFFRERCARARARRE